MEAASEKRAKTNSGRKESGNLKRFRLPAHLANCKDQFSCIFCGKMFANFSEIVKHLRSHILECPFFCTNCDGEYNSKGGLNTHSKVIHNPDRKKDKECPLCSRMFHSDSRLRRHVLSHTGETHFKCKVCEKEFHFRSKLQYHMTTHTRAREHCCQTCEKKYRTEYRLKEHVKRIHDREPRKRYPCEICCRTFSNKTYLREHMDSGHNPGKREKKFECSQCGRRFSTKRAMTKHSKNVHSGSKPFSCNLCIRNFRTEAELSVHKSLPDTVNGDYLQKIRENWMPKKGAPLAETSDIKNILGGWYCVFCKQVFNKEAKMNFHILQHIREKPLFCALCPFETPDLGNLQGHIATHNRNRKKDVECKVCGKRFYSRAAVKIHEKRHSASIARFQCRFCQKRYHTGTNLNQHILTAHEKKIYSCNICGKCISTPTNLTTHMLTHTGENRDRFPCPKCPKKFTLSSHLKKHMAQHDPARSKNFECSQCNKRFFDLSALKLHGKVHSALDHTPVTCATGHLKLPVTYDFIRKGVMEKYQRRGTRAFWTTTLNANKF